MQLLGPILNRFPFLNRETFANFLKTICQEYGVAEYYVMDASGSCLLITKEGVVKVLLMKSPSDFKNAYDIADTDGAANADILEALKTRKAFPFSGTEDTYFSFNAAKWKDAMVPMKKQSDLDLYYAVIDAPENVMSFDHYVHEIWRPKN